MNEFFNFIINLQILKGDSGGGGGDGGGDRGFRGMVA